MNGGNYPHTVRQDRGEPGFLASALGPWDQAGSKSQGDLTI